ncbi:MAG: 2-C-methyl-D-erythritol 4-phosphate cytidylyltransferase [Velocimicrobium sp.]
MKTTAIILAAGKGKRMRSDVPKQYLEVSGKPLLFYSIKAFEDSCVDEIMIVMDDVKYGKEQIVNRFGFKKVVNIIVGGKERYHSVYCGLNAAKGSDYVLIHDGARPFITKQQIEVLLAETYQAGACVSGMPVKDTIKIADKRNQVKETPNRDDVWMVQTPQVFSYSLIKNAYDRFMEDDRKEVTDDAMVLEKYGSHSVKLVKTSYRNIKITTPEDILIAEAFIQSELYH